MQTADQKADTHSLLEDAQGFIFGTAMCAFALVMLRDLGLVTGQTAGLALLISYMFKLPFGWVFFAVNLPFYWFGYKRMGLKFVLKTFACVALISVFSEIFPHFVSFETLNPVFGAIMLGFMTGAGLMAIFRHGGSLGGIGILALYLQDATKFKAGYVQLAFDACLFAVAAFILPLPQVLYSLLGAVVVNLVIAINHRRDRYIAM
ncbi:YitT family protein [Celeribacter baekdonensis]|uniref:YitT family protein n=1 Tax=Celeribacter baekdonensis TaxID=875171 RepID=A0A2R4M133_9RHOB|nr:YitT family protein [Celeribacter baekdonensis]AVW90838.1 YitT family protein [Celeribacter baekdonensis]|tara:strand:+ start:331125 stop:331739 length:615 start_codon:yes stop_codon:yes gene_type:complete